MAQISLGALFSSSASSERSSRVGFSPPPSELFYLFPKKRSGLRSSRLFLFWRSCCLPFLFRIGVLLVRGNAGIILRYLISPPDRFYPLNDPFSRARRGPPPMPVPVSPRSASPMIWAPPPSFRASMFFFKRGVRRTLPYVYRAAPFLTFFILPTERFCAVFKRVPFSQFLTLSVPTLRPLT